MLCTWKGTWLIGNRFLQLIFTFKTHIFKISVLSFLSILHGLWCLRRDELHVCALVQLKPLLSLTVWLKRFQFNDNVRFLFRIIYGSIDDLRSKHSKFKKGNRLKKEKKENTFRLRMIHCVICDERKWREKHEKKNLFRDQLSQQQKGNFSWILPSRWKWFIRQSRTILEYSFPINLFSFDYQWHQLIWSNTYEMILQ